MPGRKPCSFDRPAGLQNEMSKIKFGGARNETTLLPPSFDAPSSYHGILPEDFLSLSCCTFFTARTEGTHKRRVLHFCKLGSRWFFSFLLCCHSSTHRSREPSTAQTAEPTSCPFTSKHRIHFCGHPRTLTPTYPLVTTIAHHLEHHLHNTAQINNTDSHIY